MPCSKRMRKCYANCLHRRFVQEYVAERDAQLVRAESVARGYDNETADYFGASGRAVEEKWTFKRWLTSHAGTDFPYPRFGGRMPANLAPAFVPPELAEVPLG